MSKLQSIAGFVAAAVLAAAAPSSCGGPPADPNAWAHQKGPVAYTFLVQAHHPASDTEIEIPIGIVVTATSTTGSEVVIVDVEEGPDVPADGEFTPYYLTIWPTAEHASVELSAIGVLSAGQTLQCTLSPGELGNLGPILQADTTDFAGPVGVTCEWVAADFA